MKYRTGIGYDVHRLKKNYKFFLGGLQIKHEKGSVGHSDADTLIHAICDALLGAANLGDIGTHFPDNDPEFKNIDSKILLSKTAELVRNKNWEIANIDSVVVLQKPKIKDYIPQMKTVLAKTLNISENDISIKATTTEKMGFQGKEKGLSAYATVLICQNN